MSFPRSMTLRVGGCIFALSLAFAAPCRGLSVDSDNTDLNPDGTIPLEDLAPFGMRPDDNLAVAIGNGYFPAVPISPNYIMTAAHWVPPVNWAGWINRSVRVGSNTTAQFEVVDFYDYRMDDSWLNGGANVGPNGAFDVIVFRIEPRTENDPDQLAQWVSLYDGQEIPGSTFTRGSYGQQQKRLIPDLTLVGDPSPRGTLHWAMDRLEEVGPYVYPLAPGGQLDTLIARSTDPPSPWYTRYESRILTFDSGAGWLFQDGWEWKVNGVVSDSEIVGARMSLASNRQWISDAITAMGGALTPAPTAPPTPTRTWTGLGNEDWNTGPDNWLESAAPTSLDTVRVADAAHDANITSAPAVAAQLFIGAAGVSGTVNLLNNQPLDVAGGIFLGPESADSGTLNILADSNVTAENLYVGVHGDGEFNQAAGSVNVNAILYVGSKSGSTGSAALTGTAQLDAFALVLGHYAASAGTFQLDSPDASLNTQATYVGVNGSGQFIHTDGSHNTASLSVGANGTYALLGGTLDIQGPLQLQPTSTLIINIDDANIITAGSDNQFAGNLQLQFLDGFLPDPGDTYDLISYDTRTGDFASVTHDGPVGLIVAGSFDDPNNLYSVTFSAWSPGDADLDGDIDDDDLLTVKENFGSTDASWYDGDFDDDGIVDIDDLVFVKNLFGSTMPPGLESPGMAIPGLHPVFTPEPATAILLAAACGLAILRRPHHAEILTRRR